MLFASFRPIFNILLLASAGGVGADASAAKKMVKKHKKCRLA
jgi:hypothetical protein